MKPLPATFSGGPADGLKRDIRPCATVSLGEHTAQGSVFHNYAYACVDADTGRSVFTYTGWQWAPAPRGVRKFALRLGLREPGRVAA